MFEGEAFTIVIASTIPTTTSCRYNRIAAAIIIQIAVLVWPQRADGPSDRQGRAGVGRQGEGICEAYCEVHETFPFV